VPLRRTLAGGLLTDDSIRSACWSESENVAVTRTLAVIVTTHGPLPVQPPLHPTKAEPLAAVAVSVTVVPAAYASLQSAGHVIPPGELVTDPLPSPARVTVSVGPGGAPAISYAPMSDAGPPGRGVPSMSAVTSGSVSPVSRAGESERRW